MEGAFAERRVESKNRQQQHRLSYGMNNDNNTENLSGPRGHNDGRQT